MFLQEMSSKINQRQEYSNFLYTYCDAYHAIDITYSCSVTSSDHFFNGTVIYWCTKKKFKISRSIFNAEKRSIYTALLDQNWIRKFYRSIGYPIGPSSKLYE